MKRISKQVIPFCVLPLLTSACAPVERYHPQPIVASATAPALEGRTLLDPGLRKYVEQNSGHAPAAWPPKAWDLRLLTLAAFYFNPALDEARAQAAVADAAILTAGARPNPSLSLTPGIPNPYLFGLDFEFPVETAGKRPLRVQEATRLGEAARFELAEAAWKVRSGVRAALLDQMAAAGSVVILRAEESARSQQVKLLSQRLDAGDIARPELDASRLALVNTQAAIRAAAGSESTSRAGLAAAIGVPVSALDGIHFVWPNFEHPPGAPAFSPQLIRRDAVLNRMDVRRALAEYAVAEAALQLEIAKQHPDFQIGPGYQFEERNSFFTLGFSATLPIFNRNQGPIAEAEARRKEAAAHFLSTQARVIAQSDSALTHYRAARHQLTETQEALNKVQGEREKMALSALQAGESDRLALSGIDIESSAVNQESFAALVEARRALGELEDAVERPLELNDIPPLSPDSPALKKMTTEVHP